MDMWRFKHIIHASWVTRWEHKKTLAYCACGIAEQRRPLDKKEWPSRKVFVLGEKNIKNVPLIIREKVLLPPLHIKLGLIKKFVKALDKVGECFKHFFTKFSQLSYEKIKAGIFDGPQMRLLQKDQAFISIMKKKELNAWKAFSNVVKNF